MKETLRKSFALLLTVIMLVSTASVCFTVFAADDYKCNCGVTPVIYVKGRTNIYKDPSLGTGSENMAETNLSGGTDSVIEATSNILPALGVALLTDEWDEYCDILLEEITPIYDGYKLNEDGEKGEGNITGIQTEYQIENLLARYSGRNTSHTNDAISWAQHIQFQYDMRLDPRENAKDFKRFVDAVKKSTGHDKVNIICRCEGNVIVNAYLNMFAEEAKNEVESVIMYNSIAMGAEIADQVYTNKVNLDPDGLNRFVNTFIDTSPVLDLVKQTVNLATFTGLLEGGTDFIMGIYDKISLNLLPRLIREVFGQCPGWWGMVSAGVVDEAVEFVLGSDNADGKYDKLIDKIYGYNEIKKATVSTLKEMQNAGVKVYILTKYGDQMYPVIEESDLLGDGVVSLRKQSFEGATTSDLKGKLSDDYIAGRVEAGFGKYISADKMVDGSTAPFADYTWYIKELKHDTYPRSVDYMALDLFYDDAYVKATESFTGLHGTYSQFMYYEPSFEEMSHGKVEQVGILTPLTDENKDVSKDTTDTTSRFTVLIRWLTALINFLTSLFKK